MPLEVRVTDKRQKTLAHFHVTNYDQSIPFVTFLSTYTGGTIEVSVRHGGLKTYYLPCFPYISPDGKQLLDSISFELANINLHVRSYSAF